MLRATLLVTLILFGLTTAASDERPEFSNQLPAAASEQWNKIIHATKTWNGDFRSQIDDPAFFISQTRPLDLTNELELNRGALQTDPNYACKFPARAQLISKWFQITYQKCEAVQTWKKKLNPDSVSLVFVTQYNSNPASAFGHSFLILKNSKTPLFLNYALSNAARMPENVSGFDYIFKGLFGGFEANYSVEQFYIKVQEYHYIENRDLWSYDLNLTDLEIDQLLNHIWELDQIEQKYIFANKNCAVYIYNALAAIHPKLDFVSESSLYTLPLSTVKMAQKIVKSETFFPSHRKKLLQTLSLMNPIEKDNFKLRIKQSGNFESQLSGSGTLQYFEFLKTKNHGQLTKADNDLYEASLIARSKLGRVPDLHVKKPTSPTESFDSWRLGFQNQKYRRYFTVSPAYHSLLDPDPGFLPFSEIILFNLALDLDQNKLKKLDLIKLSHFTESESFDTQFSWQLQSTILQPEACESCWKYTGEVLGGMSISLRLFPLSYALVGYRNDVALGDGALVKLGFLFQFMKIKAQLEGKYFDSKQNSQKKESAEGTLTFPLARNLGFSVTHRISSEDETTLTLGVYF